LLLPVSMTGNSTYHSTTGSPGLPSIPFCEIQLGLVDESGADDGKGRQEERRVGRDGAMGWMGEMGRVG
jgi:hypothetical protein